MYIRRTLGQQVRKVAKSFPVLLVTGPRQVGKTTLLQHAMEEGRGYVTMDDPRLQALAKDDPTLFLQHFQPPLLIDEIQYAPELLPLIKIACDREKKQGMYWLTGSQQFHLMQNISESLAGRVGILKLQGLSYGEKLGEPENSPFLPVPERFGSRPSLQLNALFQIIWRGSFPAIALNSEMDHELFYSSYVQTYLQRDVRDLTRVGDEQAFLKFLQTAAARTGQLINYADMASDVGISPKTAKTWISILEASGLIYLLQPYPGNFTKRLVKTPKLYFWDTGLCSYLTGWTSPETLEAGALSGAILETYLVAELLKSYWHCGREAPLFFYRDKDKREIDLLILQDGVIYPMEFKKSANPGKDSIRHFSSLEKLKMPVGHGAVVSLVDMPLPLNASVNAVNVACI